MRPLPLALLLGGCSLTLDLEGPPEDPPPPSIDAVVAPDLEPDAEPVDMLTPVALDATPDLGPPPRAPVTILAPAGSRVIRHGEGADGPTEVPPGGRLALDAEAGDAMTVVFSERGAGRAQTWLVTITGVEPGDLIPVAHPAPSGDRMTSMSLTVPRGRGDAGSLSLSNGCVSRRCAGDTCAPWYEERAQSVAVTERCIEAGDRVHTVVVAFEQERPTAWAAAEDPVPADDSRPPPRFGPWREEFTEVIMRVRSEAERVRLVARPFRTGTYDLGLDRMIDAGPEGRGRLRLPGVVAEVELGADAVHGGLDRARDRPARAWRRFYRAPPAEVEIDFDVASPPTPEAMFLPAEGPRPRLTWTSAAPAAGDLARVEFQWEADQILYTWILFAPAAAEALRLPRLPEAAADLRPPSGAKGNFAQLTFLRCDGVASYAGHKAEPCPLFGADPAPRVGRTVAWTSVLASLPPEEEPPPEPP